MNAYQVGDRVIVRTDKDEYPATVTNVSVYASGSQWGVRTMGVSVRPVSGGRARVVGLGSIRPCPFCAPDEACANHQETATR